MRRIITITALCGVIFAGSILGGSYMIVKEIRRSADRQVNAIEGAAVDQTRAIGEAADEQSRAIEQTRSSPPYYGGYEKPAKPRDGIVLRPH